MLRILNLHTFFKMFLTITCITFCGLSNIFSQTEKNEYKKFYKDDIEYQTNGIDTICIIDPMPEFPNGDIELMKFIQQKLKYPKAAIKEKIEGRVYVSFVVDKSGEVINAKVIRGVREDLNEEALRVINKMPKWKPGEQNGNKVPVSFTIPINFKL